VREACRIAREAGAISIVDAAQALGQVRVDVEDLGADAVVTLGHKWLHGPLATGGFWVRDLALFGPTRLGWRSRLEVPTGTRDYNPNATRFETGTVDAAAFVGLRQTLVVHRLLGSWVSDRLRALRSRLLERIGDLPFTLRSTPEAPTGIVVVEPRRRRAPRGHGSVGGARVAKRARARRRREGDQARRRKGARADGRHRRRASGAGARSCDRAVGRAGDDPREQRGHGRSDGHARPLERGALASERRDQRGRNVPGDARRAARDAR